MNTLEILRFLQSEIHVHLEKEKLRIITPC